MSLPVPVSAVLARQLTGTSDAMDVAGLDASTPKSFLQSGDIGRINEEHLYEFRVAGITDPGVPGKQNQDDYFIWESQDRQTIVAAVFDGHGREMGQVAAKVAKGSLRSDLSRPDVLAKLRTDPKSTFEACFHNAHVAIEEAFRKYYEEQGWTVEKAPGGYLIRTKSRLSAPMCVHGGTTATVVVILDGVRVLTSNVGDSTAIMAGLGSAGTLRPIDEWRPMPAHQASVLTPGSPAFTLAGPPVSSRSTGLASPKLPAATGSPIQKPIEPIPQAIASSYMELSADHSPESQSEFCRMHKFRPHSSFAHQPELLFVYDTLSASKLACPPIFDVDARTGGMAKTERGSYYKNVRCEWATLVATPPHAPFQDALAFTRSLGDLHLQTYGVSHTPETWWMDMTNDAPASAPGGDGSSSQGPLHILPVMHSPMAVILASDGIWDNWKFEEVAQFALTTARVADVARTGSAQAAANEIMAANLDRGRANFGASADNMTVVTIYLFPNA